MSTNDENEFRAIWQNQLTTAESMDPERLRERARAFESKARRSVRVNQISAGLIIPIAAVAVFAQHSGLLTNVACAMLLITSVYMVWAFRYFFSALPIPTDANAGTCAAVHKRQLERQRDMNLSARSAGPLILPIVILVSLSRHWPDSGTYVGPEEWGFTIAFVAAVFFLMQLGFIYTDLLAHRFQREIDELESMMKTTHGDERR
jgi:hypothetical protein